MARMFNRPIKKTMMKLIWFIGQILFLVCAIIKPESTLQYLILSFEMAILYKLEDKL